MKIEANMTVRQAKETGKKFISGVALVQGGDKSLEFTINATEDNPTLVQDMETILLSFKAKRLIPVLEVTGGEIAPNPELVQASGSVPAHPKTWAGKPVHALKGNWTFDIVDAVELPPMPNATPTANAFSNAVAILQKY